MSGLSNSDLKLACREKLGVAEGDVEAVIAEARRRITVAADYERDAEVGKAVTRLNDLYARALRSQDTRTCLAVQRELNRLLGLYREAPPEDDDVPDESAEDLAKVRGHLEGLKLGKPETSTVELARMAVLRIIRLEREKDERKK